MILIEQRCCEYKVQYLHGKPYVFAVGRARSKMANLAEMLPGRAFPVGAFPDGALPDGAFLGCAPPDLL